MFKKGFSIFLILIIGSVLLSLSLGLIDITTSQIEILRERSNSLKAFYLADSGIERALKDLGSISFPFNSNLGEGSFEVKCFYNTSTSPLPSGCVLNSICSSPYICLFSVGKVKGSQRAIMVNVY